MSHPKQPDAQQLRCPPAPEARKDGIIIFEADRILQAICFHVVDEGKAAMVEPVSIRLTRVRLLRQKTRVVVTRFQWAAMSNPERLDWLLDRSKTTIVPAGQAVVLSAA